MENLLTAKEVAELFGLTPNYVWTMASQGKMPSVQIGRYRRFRASELELWLGKLAA